MTIYAWGDNELATLGLGTKGPIQTRPVKTLAAWAGVAQISAQASHTTGFFPDGHVEFVGGDYYGAGCQGSLANARLAPVTMKLPPLAAFSLVEASGLGLDEQGNPVTWGSNIFGQLGVGTWSLGREKLSYPGLSLTPMKPASPRPLAVLAGGQYMRLCLDTAGELVAWGRDDHGQLGDGGGAPRLWPAAVQLDKPGIAIAGGGSHSLVLHADGTVSGFGNTKQGQLGPVAGNYTRPKDLGLHDVVAIDAGGDLSLFLHADGTITQFGAPQAAVRCPPATAVSQGTKHALAICDGEVVAWGANEWGQIGDGTRTLISSTGVVTADHTKPDPVPLGIGAVEVSAGVIHSLARA